MKARSESKRRRPRVIPVARPAFSPALRPLFPWAWPVGVVPEDAVLRVPLLLATVFVEEVLNGTQLIKPARVAESKSPGEVQDTRMQGPIAVRMAAEIGGLHWQVVLVGEQLLRESAEVKHGI
jgi:hypothetical protein